MRTKSLILTLAITVLFGTCLSGNLAAGTQLDVPIASGYLFRGLLLNENLVFQPSLTCAAENGFAINTWGNMDLKGENMFGVDEPGQFSEVDLTVSYTLPIKPVAITIGVAQYLYPSARIEGAEETVAIDIPTTRELFAVISLPVLLSPTLSVYADVNRAEGAVYANLAVSHGITVKDLSLTAKTSLGWGSSDYNAFYLGVSESTVNELTVGLNAAYPITKNVSATASVVYFTLLDSDIEDAAKAVWDNKDDNVFGSIGASFTF